MATSLSHSTRMPSESASWLGERDRAIPRASRTLRLPRRRGRLRRSWSRSTCATTPTLPSTKLSSSGTAFPWCRFACRRRSRLRSFDQRPFTTLCIGGRIGSSRLSRERRPWLRQAAAGSAAAASRRSVGSSAGGRMRASDVGPRSRLSERPQKSTDARAPLNARRSGDDSPSPSHLRMTGNACSAMTTEKLAAVHDGTASERDVVNWRTPRNARVGTGEMRPNRAWRHRHVGHPSP